MRSSPRAWRQPLSVPATGPAAATEGGRAFFQERLAIWAKVGFLLTFSFFVLENLVPLLSLEPFPGATVQLLHVTVVVIWGATWFALQWGPFPRPLLSAIDAGIVLVGCPISVLYTVLHDPVQYYTYLPALIVFIGSVGRAIFVPSTALRTFGVSLGIAAAVHVVAAGFRPALDIPQWLPVDEMRIWALVFSSAAVVLATVASRVIYGLRQEIRKAQQLGQYTLGEKLGEGGMGMVYRARHAMLRRPTAIKLLPPEKAGENSVERFEQEVQLTALLSHPNTVAIFDYGRTRDGIFYYAMEYLEGVNLEDLVREHGPQPPARVVHILRQVCGSLREAHESGLVHRDIKPANVILCERGGDADVAKVVDFGLVKDLDQADGMTQADALTGTPGYLAPEAIRGAEADARSDLYAVGAVGYYLLAGRNVFDGATLVEICSEHLHSTPVPPSERLGRGLPPKIEGVILSCLEKDPDRRPQSARDLISRLLECDDVDPWTQDQARAWWADRSRTLRGSGATREPGAEGIASLSVDVEERSMPLEAGKPKAT